MRPSPPTKFLSELPLDQLLQPQTLPAESTCTQVRCSVPTLAYPVLGGEIGSPVFRAWPCWSRGQRAGSRPQSCVMFLPTKSATHTLSAPSTAIPHGPLRALAR